MLDTLPRSARLHWSLPAVCRLGLATRGNSRLRIGDVEHAIERGINYLNWCGHADALSRAVARSGNGRRKLVLAVQFQSRSAAAGEQELAQFLGQLRTDYIDVLTLYYVESEGEWDEIVAPGGVLEFLEHQKQRGVVRLIGLTSHQRNLAAAWARTGRVDLLMIRYNAAHRGAEQDVFPITAQLQMPVVTFTGLRWKALLEPTPADPPGFRPPTPAECYRFCLANPDVAVALTAPAIRAELDHNLMLLDDWRAPSEIDMAALLEHGKRVHEHARTFW